MNSDGVPLYAKVAATLAAEISEGVLAVGDRLPAEEGLMERFDVSRTTIRKAVENLIARGIVEIGVWGAM
ncbi:GntR family transcriptional regulator, partial [Pseudomonas sp. TNT2022 ID1044]|uniref:GntR family transcriptional regulator n=1 Tax=Pseudomonas sp. TNT2022 ID1044 TaxID=2942636 RepID=UPI00235F6A45